MLLFLIVCLYQFVVLNLIQSREYIYIMFLVTNWSGNEPSGRAAAHGAVGCQINPIWWTRLAFSRYS